MKELQCNGKIKVQCKPRKVNGKTSSCTIHDGLEHSQRTNDSNITKKDLWILSMFEEHHQHGYENVAWLIATWMKEEGTKNQILCGQLVTKLGRSLGILTIEVIQSFKTTIQMKVLDSKVLGHLMVDKEKSKEDAVIEKTRIDYLERAYQEN